MALREILNEYAVLKPVKIIAKAVFEKLYGLTNEDRWLDLLAKRASRPITVILDVGSSGGHYLTKAARFFPNAIYHHFEPRPDAANRLAACIKSLGTASIIHRMALCDQAGTAQFAVMQYGDASSLIVSDKGAMTTISSIITVATERLDDVAGIGAGPDAPIGLLKIDVEGAELRVLKGAARILARTGTLQLEISALRHARGYRETLEIFRLVFEAGFALIDTSESNYLFTKDTNLLAAFGHKPSAPIVA